MFRSRNRKRHVRSGFPQLVTSRRFQVYKTIQLIFLHFKTYRLETQQDVVEFKVEMGDTKVETCVSMTIACSKTLNPCGCVDSRLSTDLTDDLIQVEV